MFSVRKKTENTKKCKKEVGGGSHYATGQR